ncbi:hypothetical protein IAU60_003012 [Kwoniella sp. DSM 27419]
MPAIFSTALFSPPVDSPNRAVPLEPTADQLAKLRLLVEHFGDVDFTLPVNRNDATRTQLTDREMMFLSRETLLRFLKGSKGDVSPSISRLEACLLWRRTEKVDDVEAMAKDCSSEATTGKNILLGTSSTDQPIIYFFPNRNTTPIDQRRAVHGIFMLERAYDLMTAGVTNTFVVFNFAGKRQGPPTSISVARETIHILSAYYPESLGVCVFQDMPWIVKGFINLMWPFVDPVTKQKVKFASSSDKELFKDGLLDPAQLLREAGGELDLPYEHDTYWPALLKTCLNIRKEEEDRWKGLGSRQVGVAEKLFKRSVTAGLS